MSDSDRPRPARAARSAGQSAYAKTRDVLLTGIVVLLPVVVTVYVLGLAMNFLQKAINPIIKTLNYYGVLSGLRRYLLFQVLAEIGIYEDPFIFFSELIAVVVLLLFVVAAGLLAKSGYGERVIDLFDYLISLIPGVGAVYQSFRRMSDVMLESGVENFREVKLVEFPRDGVYVLGFVTNDSPPSVMAAAEVEGMTTMFLPLAPNPVMGGFLTYIPDDRIRDLDMSVQEAVQLVVTSGIATEDPDSKQYRQLTDDELEDLNAPGPQPMVEGSDDGEPAGE